MDPASVLDQTLIHMIYSIIHGEKKKQGSRIRNLKPGYQQLGPKGRLVQPVEIAFPAGLHER